MKGWKIIEPFKIEEQEIGDTLNNNVLSKVKITKALITLSDVLRYKGEIETKNIVLGSAGIGIVSETETNLFGLEKGQHVYIEPNKPCSECYNCLDANPSKCSNLQIAGEDYDGFLCDFATITPDKLFVLPESVPDLHALFIEEISLAISVVDKLGIQKGDYVAIIGANDFGNILAQLLIYYQAVPIVMCTNNEDYQIAKNSGIYYVLGQNDNWNKEVLAITSGRMTKSVVYVSDCNIPITKAFALASYNASIAFTGTSYKNNPFSFAQAIKKQLNIQCINTGFGNTATSINLIANKAINLSHLKLDSSTYDAVPATLEKMSKMLDEDGKIYETIVDLV